MSIKNNLAPSAVVAAVLAAGLATLSVGAHAANVLSNGDFEAAGPNYAAGYDGSYCYMAYPPLACGSVVGWTGSGQMILSGSNAWGTPNQLGGAHPELGNAIAGLQNTSQLDEVVTGFAGGTYTLTWSDAGRAGYDAHSYDVIVDGNLVGTYLTNAGQAWGTHTLSLTGLAAGTFSLEFLGQAARDGTSFIDNVSVSAVPEPASALLMLAGVLPLLAWRRRASR